MSVGGRETGENNEEERARETAPASQRAFQTADDGVKGPFHHKKTVPCMLNDSRNEGQLALSCCSNATTPTLVSEQTLSVSSRANLHFFCRASVNRPSESELILEV